MEPASIGAGRCRTSSCALVLALLFGCNPGSGPSTTEAVPVRVAAEVKVREPLDRTKTELEAAAARRYRVIERSETAPTWRDDELIIQNGDKIRGACASPESKGAPAEPSAFAVKVHGTADGTTIVAESLDSGVYFSADARVVECIGCLDCAERMLGQLISDSRLTSPPASVH